MARLTFDGAACAPLGSEGGGAERLSAVLDRAAVLFAFEQVGGADRCLEMARDYALQRYAFGRVIASYQAIKHKLADMYVKTELARSNAYYGAWALDADAAELPQAAAAARHRGRRGLRLRRQGEYPDPRRHGLHLGGRLPPSPAPLAPAGPGARRRRRCGASGWCVAWSGATRPANAA